jgi:hypothetical protein
MSRSLATPSLAAASNQLPDRCIDGRVDLLGNSLARQTAPTAAPVAFSTVLGPLPAAALAVAPAASAPPAPVATGWAGSHAPRDTIAIADDSAMHGRSGVGDGACPGKRAGPAGVVELLDIDLSFAQRAADSLVQFGA